MPDFLSRAGRRAPVPGMVAPGAKVMVHVASILWKEADRMRDAAEALRLTAQDLRKLGVIDRIIAEPVAGTRRDPAAAIKALGRNSCPWAQHPSPDQASIGLGGVTGSGWHILSGALRDEAALDICRGEAAPEAGTVSAKL